MTESIQKIKATTHILKLLGNELIANDSLAIFEIVKNAYDADAEKVTISFEDLNTPNQKIVIEDDGHGMSADIIKNVWLTIGTDFKRGLNRKVSKKFERTSLGNKGVGRLAVHKLANKITVETQAEGEMFGNRFTIDWERLINSKKYIQDLEVVVENVSTNFPENKGARITLDELTTKKWTKAKLREIARKVDNIKNPFSKMASFDVEIKSNNPSIESWIKDIRTPIEIIKDSLYQFEFKLYRSDEGGSNEENTAFFDYNYKFNPHALMKINGFKIPSKDLNEVGCNFKIDNSLKEFERFKDSSFLLNSDLEGIGSIQGKFYVFNSDREILRLFFGGQESGVKKFIRENYGVKIYRDNIRVFNYGELDDDWLELDLQKIRRVGDHFARKATIGVIELTLKDSENCLVEKTSRDGFDENVHYLKFKKIVQSVFSYFELIAKSDKEKIDEYIDKVKPVKAGFSESILELNTKLEVLKMDKELKPFVKKIEKDYNTMRDVMVNSGVTGLNLGIIFHEVEREIQFINVDLEKQKPDIDIIRKRVNVLINLLDNFSPFLRRQSKKIVFISSVTKEIRDLNINRLKYHGVIHSIPILTGENEDFKIAKYGKLVLGAINNLIDNALHWLRAQQDISDKSYKPAIYIGTDINSFNGNALIVADNGFGFTLEPEDMVKPFRTTKLNGVGLGLYFVSLVMEMVGGKVVFPDIKDLDIPSVYNGACVALVFPKI